MRAEGQKLAAHVVRDGVQVQRPPPSRQRADEVVTVLLLDRLARGDELVHLRNNQIKSNQNQ